MSNGEPTEEIFAPKFRKKCRRSRTYWPVLREHVTLGHKFELGKSNIIMLFECNNRLYCHIPCRSLLQWCPISDTNHTYSHSILSPHSIIHHLTAPNRLLASPRPPSLLLQVFHVPDPDFRHVVHLRDAHILEAVSICREAKRLVYSIPHAHEDEGANHDE
jgi:hypothetical protein